MEYREHLAAKCGEWRVRYPDRAAELRSIVRRWLGIGLGMNGKLAEMVTETTENEVIRAMQGWPSEASWGG